MALSPAQNVRIEYSTLDPLAAQVADRRDALIRLRNQIEDQLDVLKSGKWQGDNAEAHYRAMDELIPALNRLIAALTQTSESIGAICTIFENAESEARNHLSPGSA